MRQAWLARGPVPTPHGTRLLVFGSGAFLHTADFGRVIPKAMPRAKPGLTHRRSKAKWPQWWRTPGDTRSTSAHPTVRAGLVATLPSITESIAQHSSLGPRSPGNYSAGLPANTVTRGALGFFFLPLKSLQISPLHKPQKLLKSDRVTPGFSSNPG